MNARLSRQRQLNSPCWKKKNFLILIIVSIFAFFKLCQVAQSWKQNKNPSKENPSQEVSITQITQEKETLDDVVLPELQDEDLVFQPIHSRWENPIVIEEYKLVFFPIPKVGCSKWKYLFRRMMGHEHVSEILHDPSNNGLKYLSSFSKEEAQEMLTSKDWTRAVFVREPKERILSAFLDKVVLNDQNENENESIFQKRCCSEKTFGDDVEAQNDCLARNTIEDFSYFLQRTLDCPNPHWSPQLGVIDEKWWHVMTFIGYMDNYAADAEELLTSLRSTEKGTTAWDDYGKTGWGEDGTLPFVMMNTSHLDEHTTNARDKLYQFYNKCEEAFVEKHWAAEWEHGMYHFDQFHLFENEDLSDCSDNVMESK
jgi:hypothetical protein